MPEASALILHGHDTSKTGGVTHQMIVDKIRESEDGLKLLGLTFPMVISFVNRIFDLVENSSNAN